LNYARLPLVPVGCAGKQQVRECARCKTTCNLQASLVYGPLRQHRYRGKSELFVSSCAQVRQAFND